MIVLEIWTTVQYDAWVGRLRDSVAKAMIAARLDRLENSRHWGDCKPVGDGIVEIRVDGGPGYRLYCKRIRRSVVLVLTGGEKGTQRRDIRRAKEIARAWQV